MPVIDIDGERKKVACGPCIRGHRSSKCQHGDRVLIEVRKPGRPLSACPHPTGSCGCQRAVFYTVPKNETDPTPSGPLSPAPTSYGSQSSSNRISKSKLRKNSTTVSSISIQRALDSDPSALVHQGNQIGLSHESSDSSSNVPSLVSSSSSTPQIDAVDISLKSTSTLPSMPEVDTAIQAERFPLGVLDAASFGTASNDLGWTGEWPDYNSAPPLADRIMDTPANANCCRGSVQCSEPEPVAPTKSCCAGKNAPSTTKQTLQPEYFGPIMHTRGSEPSGQLNLNFPASAPLNAYEFEAQSSNELVFTEDHFGCLHEPDHTCQCGEGCECLGCSLHPANRTTTDYVRYHTELTMREWADPIRFQMPGLLSQSQQFGNFASTQQLQGFQNMGIPLLPQHNSYMVQPQYMQPQFMPQWRNTPTQMATPNLEMSQFSFQATPLTHTPAMEAVQARPCTSPQSGNELHEALRTHARHISANDANTYDHDSPSTEDDASTLSPSAFSVQRYDIPGGCNDMTGNCSCGEGCECEGCLTHNGRRSEQEASQIDLVIPRTTTQTISAHTTFEDMLQEAIFPLTGPG